MTELEQELTDLRNAIKEMKAIRDRVGRMKFLGNLDDSNPKVAKYFYLATLIDCAAVKEALQGVERQVSIEIGEKTPSYIFGKLCLGKTSVADVTFNRRFRREAMEALESLGIQFTEFDATAV